MAIQPKYGQSAALNAASSPSSTLGSDSFLSIARVLSVVLSDAHPRYQELQGPLSIGSIEIEQVNPPSNSSGQKPLIAKPLFPNLVNYPIINELVVCIKGPSRFSQTVTSNQELYYFPAINIWNSVNQNILPNSVTNQTPISDNIIYEESTVLKGVPNLIPLTTSETKIPNQLGSDFPEKENIKPLLMFEGDVIYQGRWGNSIRFGSTSKNKSQNLSYINSWSASGSLGSPITIIRNGQQPNTSQEFGFITENVNLDDSSIWLTKDQQLPSLLLSNQNYSNYNKPIISPPLYNKNQIIINSGRVILNAKSDSILLSSQKSIALNTNEDLNVYTNGSTIINSSFIYLGNKNATQSVLLGDDTVTNLEQLMEALLTLITPLTNLQTFVENTNGIVKATPNTNVIFAAKNAKEIIQTLKNQLGSLKSKSVKTI